MSTDQETMVFGREGNRRSGVALAMRHRLCGISTYGLNGQRKGDEHRAYTHSSEESDMHSLPFYNQAWGT